MSRLDMSILYDYYGELLTDKQKDCYDLYYNDDLSLTEIAELKKISRQGAWDNIRHAESKLKEFENKTGLVARIRELEAELAEIKKNGSI